MPPPTRYTALLALCGAVACSRGGGSATCGITALTGALAVKESFATGHALLTLPDVAPQTIPVRFVAGILTHGAVSRDTSGWRISLSPPLPKSARAGYGVLVVDLDGVARGVLVFDGGTFRGARLLGGIAVRDTTLPLLGTQIDPRIAEDSTCPLFVDTRP